jgi:Ala-tRNA(Pro) deacylase
MSGVNPRLQALLDESGVSYEIIHHREDFRARTTAEDTHTPPSEFVKTVFVWIDGGYAMVALPATHFLAEGRMARSLGAEEIRLASESEIANLCPDCEVGAAPPFGKLFELATYASPGLAEDEHITFNAGTHRDAVRLRWADYERLVQPKLVHLARHEEQREKRGPR